MIYKTKVVSKNFFADIITRIQNFLGRNLKPYEKMVDAGIKQLEDELSGITLAWFRLEITQLTNGAVSITLYGEEK